VERKSNLDKELVSILEKKFWQTIARRFFLAILL
jgi:hypothetical protein